MSRVVAVFREIRERRIFRALVSYLAAGWVVLEVLDQFVDRGVVPDILYRLALLWYMGGIPACLIIGWFHGEKGAQKAPRLELLSLGVLVLICLGMSSVAVSEYRTGRLAVAAAERGLDLRRVAVLYFQDITRGGELQYLADGLTEELIQELDRVDQLEVVSRNGVAQFQGADLATDSIARLLSVGTVVDGTVERVGERVRVNVRLVDGGSGAEFRRAGFERPASEVSFVGIREELARETSRFLREWLGEEVRLRELERGSRSPAAWALYQRAEKARKDAEARLRHDDPHGMAALFQRADALLAQAEALDSGWVEPVVLRGFLAERQSRLSHDRDRAVGLIHRGLEHAERALRRAPRHARALELRGKLHYWHYLLRVTPDPARQMELLRAARQDLEAAVEADPSLASAHSALSHLYFSGDRALSVIAARKAYEEDAYLDVANDVLWRLFTGNYDLSEFRQARHWCGEGARRFAHDYRFTKCELWLMTTPTSPPDVGSAWRLLARLDSLVPQPRRAYEGPLGEMLVGGVIARAGLADSARRVMSRARARVSPEADPAGDLLQFEAHMRTLAGDTTEAIELLTRYAARNSHYSFEHHWWWQGLRSSPRFSSLRTNH